MTADEYDKIGEVTAKLTGEFVRGARVRILNWPHEGQEARVLRRDAFAGVLVGFTNAYNHVQHVWVHPMELKLL